LPKEDIERMVREAEEHAEEDKRRREAADVRNNAENLAYQTEKLLTDNDDKLPEEVKTEMQGDVDAVKEALKGEDDDAVKTAYDKLVANQQKIGEAIYNQQGAEGAAAGDEAGADSSAGAEDDVVDAEAVDEAEEAKIVDPGAGQAGTESADASDLGVDIPADASSLEDAEQTEEPEPGSEAAAYLADLKRINAEYAAYRMRADRERERAALGGTIKVVEALIPVLDEVKLARENGDVTGPFETHVNKLVDSLAKLGVEQYGEVGDEFDPNIHEALMQQPSDDVENPTVFLVMQPGYR